MASAKFNKKSEEIVEGIYRDLVPGNETSIDCYTQHAKHYDEGMLGIKYRVPEWCAEQTMKHLQTNSKHPQLLDICVGTGLTSKAFADNGFKGAIDGVDGNQTMLDEARKKGIFRNLTQCIITPDTKLPFPDETYDIIVCTGSFSAGHIRPECLPDFFRVLKQGGTFAFNTTNFNSDDNAANEADLNKADGIMEELEKSGICELMEMIIGDSMASLSPEFKYIKGNKDKFRCYRKKTKLN